MSTGKIPFLSYRAVKVEIHSRYSSEYAQKIQECSCWKDLEQFFETEVQARQQINAALGTNS